MLVVNDEMKLQLETFPKLEMEFPTGARITRNGTQPVARRCRIKSISVIKSQQADWIDKQANTESRRPLEVVRILNIRFQPNVSGFGKSKNVNGNRIECERKSKFRRVFLQRLAADLPAVRSHRSVIITAQRRNIELSKSGSPHKESILVRDERIFFKSKDHSDGV